MQKRAAGEGATMEAKDVHVHAMLIGLMCYRQLLQTRTKKSTRTSMFNIKITANCDDSKKQS